MLFRSTADIKALEDLVREYGFTLTPAQPASDSKVSRKPNHLNTGKNYRTKKAILNDLTATTKAIQESLVAQKEAQAIAKQKRVEAQTLDNQIVYLKNLLNTLLTEAHAKKITRGELSRAKVILPSGRPRKESK